MTPREEIELVRARMQALERDLGELKERIRHLETQWPAAAAEPPPSAPVDPQPVLSGAGTPEAAVPPVLSPLPPPLEGISAAAEFKSAAAPARHPLREWLEPLQLWPPGGEENAEVRLAAWWATRIGALLAVIGIVFLGLYVSRNSPPWVRLAEVVAVTAGVLGLGAWLERKLPKFGAVVFGAGLALAYFCAFAAYAVPPMKVISSSVVATFCEMAVVAGILAVAWRRSSQVVATIAVALGHVTAFLALRGGSTGFGPAIVFMLGGVAVAFRFARRWDAPSVLAMPLAWLFLAVATVSDRAGTGMPLIAAWLWAVVYFALYLARDWVVARRGGVLTPLDRALQVTNSTLALAMGLWVTSQAVTPPFAQFYFGGAVVMAAAAWAWRRAGAEGVALVPIFACKVAALTGLGIIAALDGHARSLVLLAQAFALLVAARRSAVRGLRTATVITGAVALAFYLSELRPENAALASTATLIEVVFLAGAMAFVAALQRWLALDAARTAFGTVVLGIVAIATALTWETHGWAPALQIGLGLVVVAAAAGVRGWLPAGVGGTMLLAAAHVEMCTFDAQRFSPLRLWANEAILLAAVAGAAAALARWQHAEKRRVHGFFAALASGTLVVVCFKAFSATLALALGAAVALVLALAAGAASQWPFASLAAPLLGVSVGLLALYKGSGDERWLGLAAILAWAAPSWLTARRERLESIHTPGWRAWAPAVHTALATLITLLALQQNLRGDVRVVAAAATALAVFALAWRAGLRSALPASWVLWTATLVDASDVGATALTWVAFGLAWLPALAIARGEPKSAAGAAWSVRGLERAQRAQVTLAVLIGLVVAVDVRGPMRHVALGGVALVAYAAWRWGRVAPARTAAVAVVAIGWTLAWFVAATQAAQGWGAGLAAVLATGVVTAGLPFAVERESGSLARRRLRWAASVGALALLFYAFAVQRGTLADYATVGWGLAAAGLFLAGLFLRSRAHRLVGLAGLALCVPRAFIVDLDSTLHRIAAFVALGVVLLWVGFSYHRFRHLVADEEK